MVRVGIDRRDRSIGQPHVLLCLATPWWRAVRLALLQSCSAMQTSHDQDLTHVDRRAGGR